MGKGFYCIYCGRLYSDLTSMVRNICPYHPDGHGYHKPFEGPLREVYTCRYCGWKFRDFTTMVRNRCPRHPDGTSRGCHSPLKEFD